MVPRNINITILGCEFLLGLFFSVFLLASCLVSLFFSVSSPPTAVPKPIWCSPSCCSVRAALTCFPLLAPQSRMWGQSTRTVSSVSPKRDCGAKRDKSGSSRPCTLVFSLISLRRSVSFFTSNCFLLLLFIFIYTGKLYQYIFLSVLRSGLCCVFSYPVRCALAFISLVAPFFVQLLSFLPASISLSLKYVAAQSESSYTWHRIRNQDGHLGT